MLNLSKRLVGSLIAILLTINLQAQDDQIYITVATVHFNMDNEDGSVEDWLALEKEYHEKVTMKNDLILNASFLTHYFTEDNSEAKVVRTFKNWADIDAAGDMDNKLAKEAWPDSIARQEFFKKMDAYYQPKHSDEIYHSLAGAKFMAERPTESMVYYVRVTQYVQPEDGTVAEITSLMKEFNTAVIQANPFVKAYYPHRHGWGADSRDIVEAFVFSSLGDIEKSFEKNTELINAKWPDEKKRDAFFDKMDKYFTPYHADYIYRSVPELYK
jgi:hypothetical protein